MFDASVVPLRRLVRRRAHQADVDDIIQEAFAQLLRRGTAVDTNQPMMPLLTRVAQARAIDTWRARRRELVLDPPDQADDRLPGDALDDEVSARVVHATLAQLRPRYRRLLIRWACQQAPIAEVADEEGVSPAAVKMALSRARRGFRETYERELERAGLLALLPSAIVPVRRLRARLESLASTGQLATDRLVVGAAGVAVLAVGACGMLAGAGGAAANPQRQINPKGVAARFVASGYGTTSAMPSFGRTSHALARRPGSPEGAPRRAPAISPPTRVATRVTVGEHSAATFSTGWENPVGEGHGEASVSFQCTEGIVWSASCTVLRALPARHVGAE